jgi:hypothetical protein
MFDPVQTPPLGRAFERMNAAIMKADFPLRHQRPELRRRAVRAPM